MCSELYKWMPTTNFFTEYSSLQLHLTALRFATHGGSSQDYILYGLSPSLCSTSWLYGGGTVVTLSRSTLGSTCFCTYVYILYLCDCIIVMNRIFCFIWYCVRFAFPEWGWVLFLFVATAQMINLGKGLSVGWYLRILTLKTNFNWSWLIYN